MNALYLLEILLSLYFYLYTSEAVNSEHAIRMNSGYDCPLVGLGLGGYATGGPPQGELVLQMVEDAIEVGYRHFDTSYAYRNEQEIGDAITKAINNGLVNRSDIFLTTKLTPDEINGHENANKGIILALEKLNISYIDLLLIHFPRGNYLDGWVAMEDAVRAGLVRSIGVSNFNETDLEKLLKVAKIKPSMNQIQSYPGMNHSVLINYCKQLGIRVTAYSPLGAGTQLNNSVIVDIGDKHNKSSAQVMIRWQVQRGVAAIPKTTNRTRMVENLNVFDFSLTDEEMLILENLS